LHLCLNFKVKVDNFYINAILWVMEKTTVHHIESFLAKCQVDLWGFTHLEQEKFQKNTCQLPFFPFAVSLAMRLSLPVMKSLNEGANRLYAHHYRLVNSELDRVGWLLARELEDLGYRALAVPTSQILDWNQMRAHISHREIAVMAGLGWRGRSSLVVTPQFGSRIRLATVLTDAPLPQGKPLPFSCGDCTFCQNRCKGNAISIDGYDRDACLKQMRAYNKKRNIGLLICGLCLCDGPPK